MKHSLYCNQSHFRQPSFLVLSKLKYWANLFIYWRMFFSDEKLLNLCLFHWTYRLLEVDVDYKYNWYLDFYVKLIQGEDLFNSPFFSFLFSFLFYFTIVKYQLIGSPTFIEVTLPEALAEDLFRFIQFFMRNAKKQNFQKGR